MNKPILYSACPHDCPSTCALEVELDQVGRIDRVRGAIENSYTNGVICSKVARYRERIHHPDRLTTPLRRKGGKQSGDFEPISWENALDETAERLLKAEQHYGSETVWPYFFAGTMGLVMRDGINRLRHAKHYSGEHKTICTTPSFNGFIAGTGKLAGVDPREMADSDQVILWGTNAASTQVNVMSHVLKGRQQRGACLVVVDTYNNATAKQADLFVCVRPGTDGALACAIMHVLFRDGFANWEYLNQYTDDPEGLEQHLKSRTPEWASAISGVDVKTIEKFAHMIGATPRTYFRLGYGFARQRNGAFNMHAVTSIAAVAGSWLNQGGGALHNNGDIYHWDKTLIEGLDVCDSKIRVLDMSRIGAILTGDNQALSEGPPVTALFIQNTNPMSVAPDLNKVHEGFLREDLFTCVHEQFMTETAMVADLVCRPPLDKKNDDVYQGGGHQHIILGPKIIEPLGDCRSNHEVICELAHRLGAEHRGFHMTAREIIDQTLQDSGWGTLEHLESVHWIDCQPPFDESHYVNGFAHTNKRFHFSPNWSELEPQGFGPEDSVIPKFPDHVPVIEESTADMPFRLVTAPARHYLNSSFNETPTSIRREKQPTVMVHPDDVGSLGVHHGDEVRIGNSRGELTIVVQQFDGVQKGVVIVESIWPNKAFKEGKGINVLTGADPIAPNGGAAFHDNRIWIRPV